MVPWYILSLRFSVEGESTLTPTSCIAGLSAAVFCKGYAASDVLKYDSGFLQTDSSFAGTVGDFLAVTDALLTCCTAECNGPAGKDWQDRHSLCRLLQLRPILVGSREYS